MESFTCKQCDLLNCDLCEISYGKPKCTQCAKGFYEEKSSNACKECSNQISGCSVCNLVFNAVTFVPTCTECQSGYGIVPIQSRDRYIAGCRKCIKCNGSCYFNNLFGSSEEYCVDQTCPFLIFDWSAKQCKTCKANECTKCFNSQEICHQCDQKFSLSTNLECTPCPLGCICNGASNGCIRCDKGYYYSEEKCIMCPSSCKECVMGLNNSVECTVCKNGYYLDKLSNKCLKCSSSCTSCIDSERCTECTVGLKLNSNMKCECHESSSFYNGTNCVKCNAECIGCTNLSSNCTKCSSSSLVHIQDNAKCGFLNEDKSIEHSCCKCIGSRFFNSTNGQCEKCSNGCAECSQENKCTKCESSDLELTSDQSQCVCKQSSSFYDQFRQKCTECGSLCLQCTSLSDCQKCISPSLSNVKGSCYCNSGNYYDKFSDSCKPCDGECSECMNQSNYCTACKESKVIPYNGRCKCQDLNQIMNQDGECICAPNFYNHPVQGCIKMCQKIELVDKFKDEVLKISKLPNVNLGVNKNILFNVNIDDSECAGKMNNMSIRFIEWNFYDALTNFDLKQGRVGEVGDLFVKLNQDTLNSLPLNKVVTLKIKILLSVSEIINGLASNQIIEATDFFNFTIIQSPIIVKLSGKNTVYGRNELVAIDASETYDPDIEGMHYYLPFIFLWGCPSEIPVLECKEKTPLSGKTYSISFYSSLLIQYGLKFNQFYKFEATATRLNKTQEMSFWIKLLDYETVPKIELDQLSKSTSLVSQENSSNSITIISEKYLILCAKIISDKSVKSLNWFLETKNGMMTHYPSNSNEELKIEKSELIKQKISKIYAKAELPSFIDFKGVVRNNLIIEAFYEYSFKPPTISGQLEPSLKIIVTKKSKYYLLLNIEIINSNSLESWIYPLLYSITAIRRKDNDLSLNSIKDSEILSNSKLYLIEESVSRSYVKLIVSPDVEGIELKVCTTLTKDCLNYSQNASQILNSSKPSQIDFESIQVELLGSTDFNIASHSTKINALVIVFEMLQTNIDYAYQSNFIAELLEKSSICFEGKVLAPKGQSTLLIEIIQTLKIMLDPIKLQKYIDSDDDNLTKQKLLKDSVLKYLPKIFAKDGICNIFKDFDVDTELMLQSINMLTSTLFKSASTVSDIPLLAIDFIELAIYIIRNQESCIVEANLLTKSYLQIQNETIHYIRPLYFIQYFKNTEENICSECMQISEQIQPSKNTKYYSINAILGGFNKNSSKKQYTFINIIKNTMLGTKFIDLYIDQNNISLNNIAMILSVDTLSENYDYNRVITKQIEFNVPLSELQFTFNSEISPIEYYSCYSHTRYPTGLFAYYESAISKNRNKLSSDIKSSVWESQLCTNSYNSTHFTCKCNNTGMISIRYKEENIYALKIFFLGVIFFTMMTVYCCTVVCTSSTNEIRNYTLIKLQPIINLDLTKFSGVFCVMFSTLHVLCCCRRNPIMGTQKSVSIFILVIFSMFNMGLLMLNLLSVSKPKQEKEYIGWSTRLSYKLFIPFGCTFILVFYEFFKCMFIRTPYHGMVKFKDEGESLHAQKPEEVKEGEKVDEELDEKANPEKVKEFVVSDCNQIVQTNPASTARDPNAISSQRQMKTNRNNVEVVGVAGRYMIDVTKDCDVPENEYNIGDNDIILAADEFEEPTRFNKFKLTIGICLILIMSGIPFTIIMMSIQSLNIYATFICLLYSIICIALYMFIIQPVQILLMSCSFLSKNKYCNMLQKLIITEECTLIIIKLLKVQNAIEKEKMEIQKNKIIQEEIETARKRENDMKLQNEIFGPHEKFYPFNPSDVTKSEQDSRTMPHDQSTTEFDIAKAKIQRRRHRNPTQTNKIIDKQDEHV